MAIDFSKQLIEVPTVLSGVSLPATRRRNDDHTNLCNADLKWRRNVFDIVYDSLNLVRALASENSNTVWRHEAQQRAHNFARIGLSDILPDKNRPVRQNWTKSNVEAVATLGGSYRLLAKCTGTQPVECEHILRTYVTNLILVYAPVCGESELDLILHPIILVPIKCRAFVLCVGMLIHGAMQHYLGCRDRASNRIQIHLSKLDAETFVLNVQCNSSIKQLLASPEFNLACRLCGIFQSEVLLKAALPGAVILQLTFPAL